MSESISADATPEDTRTKGADKARFRFLAETCEAMPLSAVEDCASALHAMESLICRVHDGEGFDGRELTGLFIILSAISDSLDDAVDLIAERGVGKWPRFEQARLIGALLEDFFRFMCVASRGLYGDETGAACSAEGREGYRLLLNDVQNTLHAADKEWRAQHPEIERVFDLPDDVPVFGEWHGRPRAEEE
jgi:hypothetical protein